MPQTHADPEDIERFARTLKQFNNDLSLRMAELKRQFTNLGATWHDQEYARFAQEFQQTSALLDRFMRKAEDDVSSLMKKVSILRDYHK